MSKLKEHLLSIQRQFLACEPISNLFLIESLPKITWEDQELLVNATVNHSLVKQYPVKTKYQMSFLQEILTGLEEQFDTEIHDEIYNVLCQLKSKSDQDKWFYKHYILDLNNECKKIITLKESANIVSEGTTGLCSWKAAQALATYCFQEDDIISDKSILELGSGTGLLGLFLSAIGKPKRYTFSDCHPSVLKLLNDNVSMNLMQQCHEHYNFPDYNIDKTEVYEEVESEFMTTFRGVNGDELDIMYLPWEEVEYQTTPKCDLVLAADVVYDPVLIPWLCNSIKFLLKKNADLNCEALVACTLRNAQTIKKFIKEIRSLNLEITEEVTIKSCRFNEDDKKFVNIYKIRLGDETDSE